MIRRWIAAVLVVALICGVTAFFKFREPSDHRCADCNVILISIDTLRRDHLSAYGYDRPTSPHLAGFRKDAVFFDTAISQAPSTTPSHGSLFTSLIPSEHGAFVMRKSAIRDDVKTIAEIFHDNGFKTASFNGGAQMNGAFGFQRGFDVYKSFTGGDYTTERFSDRVHEGIDWLNQNKAGGKFFLFLHSYDVHHPYSPDQKNFALFKDPKYSGQVALPIDAGFLLSANRKRRKLDDADRREIVSAYDAEIRGVDEAFAELINYLRESGLYDKTLIVFTSDHGEEFNEHGWMGWHSHTLYDELLRVPFAIKFPAQKFAGTTVTRQVRGIDMLPTVLDIMDIDRLPGFQGRTLMKLIRGEPDADFPEFAVSQRESRGRSVPTSIRTTKWKLAKKKLYNLENDPSEKENVSDENPAVVEQLKQWRRAAMGSEDS